MGFFARADAIEDEIIDLISKGSEEALKSVPAGHIVKGLRSLTSYVNKGGFPWVEVSWARDTFDEAGTELREHVFEIQVACLIKSEKPRVGLERAKIMIGEVYDILTLGDNESLSCGADLLAGGAIEMAPPDVTGLANWLYVAVASFNYFRRL